MTRAVQPAMTGLRKAAILLVLLGEEAASAICRNLPQDGLHHLTQEIAELDSISPEAADQVLQEYHQLTSTQEYLAQGGTEYATKMLVKAFGEERAQGLLAPILQAQGANAGSFEFLHQADPQQLARFVEGEHPQTIALVLAQLGAKPSSSLLMLLPETLRVQVVQHMAEMGQFSPEMLQKISVVLNKKLQALGEQDRLACGGVKAVTDMLNRLDPDSSNAILETIEQDDPQTAVAIRNLMFTFEDLLSVSESGIRELLSQMDKKTLALALKGVSEDAKNHIFKSMSSRAVEMLKDDMEALGPVRSREAQEAQQQAVELARKLEADGKLTLKTGGDEAYLV